MNNFDVIVIGLGGMGSAAADALAGRGFRVLALDQFAAGHTRGSSHGHSRIIRTAYYEHPDYVPLCRAAFAAWTELECDAGRPLLVNSPCLTIGPPDGELVTGVARAAADHGLCVTPLSPAEMRHAYPQFRFDDGYAGIVERDAGILLVDECVREMQNRARRRGAELRTNEAVTAWTAEGGVKVRTTAGEYVAERLVIAAGPWAAKLVPLPLTVMRQVPMWFTSAEPHLFRRDRFPVFIAETPAGHFYGLPALDGRGAKIAQHYGAAELADISLIADEVTDADEPPVRAFVSAHIPGIGLRTDASVCRYTLTPDRHFIIGFSPEHANVVVAAGFSGHGFKFAPVVGSIVADLVQHGRTPHAIGLFSLERIRQ